ncbi:fungal-specific transcription factor domain-containing protein [Aspergillus cavernicola]|uniref:Fungal-specific transcription factor domain-containing protein n=1 Tax=Aspergillus cavernicola TaxID=176166 RepID=A0ABR4HQ16_9EURO
MDSPRRARNRAACTRCQRRKIRCDGNLPSCGSCRKAAVPCINDGKQEVHRSYIANLERRIKWLESIVREKCPDVDLSRRQEGLPEFSDETMQPITIGDTSQDDPHDGHHSRAPFQEPPAVAPAVNEEPQQVHEIGLVSLSPGGDPRYIGPSSGYFFAKRILTNAGLRGMPKTSSTSTWNVSGLPLELLNTPAPLPMQKESAMELSTKYFRTVHLLYPFLHEQTHLGVIDRVYASQEETPLESFQLYMVLAIASLNLSRQCKLHLPVEGYYASAMKHVDYVCNHGSVTSLQCLLLLMVYALYNPSCNINIWNLNYQCLASVIDLGLQRDVRASSSLHISVFDQEMRTRIFWVAYTFDRTVCTMMGRPIGIRDEACDIRFPQAIPDNDLTEIGPDYQTHNESISHMSYPAHLFRLSQLNSEIKYVMHSINRDAPAYALPPVRDIRCWQQDMMISLSNWLLGVPQHASGTDTEIVLLCKVKYHETMILLLRPSPGIPSPSEEILDECFNHALMLLQGFSDLYTTGNLLYNRLVVHSLFLGTLVMLFCIWRLPWTAVKIPVNDLITKFGTAQNILSSIGEHWAEATRARDCIKELSTVTIQRLLRSQHTITATGQSARSDSAYQRGDSQHPGTSQPQQQDQVDGNFREVVPDTNANSNMEPWSLNETHVTLDVSVSEFSNLFDDLLQGDFPGWSGMSDIDGVMWEIFNTALQ